MEEAARSRAATREAVEDVSPPRLRELLDDHLAASSMVPGALTLLSCRAVGGDGTATEAAVRRAAGVQLIYEGLRLTRRLVADNPWEGEVESDIPADVDVLAADVLVARGFRLLARTEAADLAVEVVREFGRAQTAVGGEDGEGNEDDRSLERSIFDLAAVAGATAGGRDAPQRLRQYAAGLAGSREPPLDPSEEALSPEVVDELRRLGAVRGRGGGDGPAAARSVNRND